MKPSSEIPQFPLEEELCCIDILYEDTWFYLGLEESRSALEFLLTLEKYDERGNILLYNMQ